jgi:hypothetical protein
MLRLEPQQVSFNRTFVVQQTGLEGHFFLCYRIILEILLHIIITNIFKAEKA